MPALSCNYYVRRSDSTLWAILCENGAPARAVGPLQSWQTQQPAPGQDYQGPRSVDAKGWSFAGFTASAKRWELVLAPPPITRKPVLETDGKTGFRVGFFG